MRKTLTLVAMLLSLGCVSSQAPLPQGPKPGSDEFAIETTVLAVYNVISGPAGRRDWDRFKDLFAPDARLMVTRTKDGVTTTTVMTPDEFVKTTQPNVADQGFFEHPIATRTERFRDIAHVFSTYESRHTSTEEQPYARGINSFQLVRSGDRWLIETILWEAEDSAHPLPAEYLPPR